MSMAVGDPWSSGGGVSGGRKCGRSSMIGEVAVIVMRIMVMAVTALSVISAVMGQPSPSAPGHPGQVQPLPDVIERSTQGKNLTLYVGALRSSRGALMAMEAQRRRPGGVTIFAPTDAAVSDQIQRLGGCLAAIPDVADLVMTSSLLYSAVPGHLPMAEIRSRLNQSNGSLRLPTLYPPNEVAVSSATSRYPSTKMGVFVDGAQIFPSGGFDVVTAPDVVVQMVDTLLIPRDTTELISEFCGEATISVPPPISPGTP
ncbi:hypothetical protein CBR_g44509 [Chara braunii]|uniref:FAS1 domain-containing protein n=1 Tax=Chara braunii TaxID=69332 RepID=A0A388LXU3_CHABU|nr:hypothetical protein CBR_g44509 [Chara braunii]|eukprot:GBG87052.1 hypothetical protein CBR_g44509 [Chara braunii]